MPLLPPADGGRGAVLPALLGRVLDVLMSCASGSAKMGRRRSRSHQTDTLVCIRRSTDPGAILTGKDESYGPFKTIWQAIWQAKK